MKKHKRGSLTEKEMAMLIQRDMIRREQGLERSHQQVSDKEKLVNAINLLLCCTKQDDIIDTAVGLKTVIQRLDLEDVCHIWIDTGAKYKLRLYFTGKEEEGIA